MNLKITRKIERYIGSPACFVLTIFYKINIAIKKVFNIKDKRADSKVICFVELSEMGSIVLAASAILKIKKENPDIKIYFLVFKNNKIGIEALGLIPKENILTIDGGDIISLAFDSIKFMFIARKRKIDTMIDLELFSRYTAILSLLSGAKKRIGFSNYTNEGLYRGGFLTHNVIYNNNIHISKNFLNQTYCIKENSVDDDGIFLKKEIKDSEIIFYKKKISDKEKSRMWNFLKGYNKNISSDKKIVIINPNAGEQLPIRAWPIERYIALIKKLLKNDKVFILITGLGEEAEEDGQKIIKDIKDKRVINLVGETTFDDLVGLFYISNILITNDSGPAHFATLSNIEIITFFGPETPKLYGPISKTAHNLYTNLSCSPCLSAHNSRNTVCKNNRCLKNISVDTVYDLTKNLLKI